MNPEMIAEKLWSEYTGEQAHSLMCEITFHQSVKRAIELHEASKWKYPEKGELPEGGYDRQIIFATVPASLHLGYYFKELFGSVVTGVEYESVLVPKWQYAPEVE